jgi:hypothetical protein
MTQSYYLLVKKQQIYVRFSRSGFQSPLKKSAVCFKLETLEYFFFACLAYLFRRILITRLIQTMLFATLHNMRVSVPRLAA